MIQVNGLSKAYGGQTLFENLSFLVNRGEKIGLVGRNGAGKSTLFKILLGEETYDDGEIQIPKGYRIGKLDQHISFKHKTVIEECGSVLTGDNQYDTYKAEKILMGLGFTLLDFEKDPWSFSGGYQVRIQLCKALLEEPDMLLLDEPNNYLDIISMRWLKGFLKSIKSEMIIITHDREFMDEVCTHTMGIYLGKLRKIQGPTEKYYEALMLEEELQEKNRETLIRKRADLQKFIDRFKAKASKAAQAQSRQKQLEKLGNAQDIKKEKTLEFSFKYKETQGKELITLADCAFGYNPEDLLFEKLNITVKNGDRIGIIGKNGKGKSTLMNVMCGENQALTGSIKNHISTVIGHFGQTNIGRLHLNNNIIEEIGSANNGMGLGQIRNICGTMMFDGDLAEKKIKVLSGGERARVMLGKILATPCNVLMLDEPTNHLDMYSIESLTNELTDFAGAIVVVTHNENLLHAFAEKLIVFQNDTVEVFDGTYQDFLDRVGWANEKDHADNKKVKVVAEKISHKDYKNIRSELVKERSSKLKPYKELMEKAEKEIVIKEDMLAKINDELLKVSESGDGKKIAELGQKVKALENEVESWFTVLEDNTIHYDKENAFFEARLNELEEKIK